MRRERIQEALLSQTEVERLIALEKKCTERTAFHFPFSGKKINIPLVSFDNKVPFLLDVNSSCIALKYTFQSRFQNIPLIRIDLRGRHKNPDDTYVDGPHIHRYKEGEGLQNAVPLTEEFGDTCDVKSMFQKFMDICSVIERPIINYSFIINGNNQRSTNAEQRLF